MIKSNLKTLALVFIIVSSAVLGVNVATAYSARKRPLIDNKILLPSGKMGDISIVKSDMNDTYDIIFNSSRIASIDNSNEGSNLSVFSDNCDGRIFVAVEALNTEYSVISIYGNNGVSFELQSSALSEDLRCALRKTDKQQNVTKEFVDQTGDGIFDVEMFTDGRVVDCSYWDKAGIKWREIRKKNAEGSN